LTAYCRSNSLSTSGQAAPPRSCMTKISSKSTFFYKRIFPILWFGFIAVFVAITIISGVVAKSIMFLIMPLFMIIIGVIVMKKLVWDLADEVYDCGDTLLVRSRGGEQRVALSNIMNVSATTYMNPPRVTLRLVSGGRMGREISFTPAAAFTLNPFAKNQVVEDLIVRVDRARAHRMV
jgi:hypothetical protein